MPRLHALYFLGKELYEKSRWIFTFLLTLSVNAKTACISEHVKSLPSVNHSLLIKEYTICYCHVP